MGKTIFSKKETYFSAVADFFYFQKSFQKSIKLNYSVFYDRIIKITVVSI